MIGFSRAARFAVAISVAGFAAGCAETPDRTGLQLPLPPVCHKENFELVKPIQGQNHADMANGGLRLCRKVAKPTKPKPHDQIAERIRLAS